MTLVLVLKIWTLQWSFSLFSINMNFWQHTVCACTFPRNKFTHASLSHPSSLHLTFKIFKLTLHLTLYLTYHLTLHLKTESHSVHKGNLRFYQNKRSPKLKVM